MANSANEPTPDSPGGEGEAFGYRPELDFAELSRRLDKLWPEATNLQSPLSGRRIAHYDLLRVLGSGSFGVVYLANDTLRDQVVALKVPRPEVLLDEDKRQRFSAEASLVAKLDHAGIVPVYLADLDGPAPYIASEYVPGPNLEQWLLKQAEGVPERQAAAFISRLAEAVEYAHQQGVVHRDLKPSNVLLAAEKESEYGDQELRRYRPRLTDFGLAKHLEVALTETRSSLMLGTPLYMAPEQFSDNPNGGSPAADIHAVGVLLYELLTLKTPYTGATYVEIADQIRNQPLKPLKKHLPALPEPLARICHQCLEKEPCDRYATAGDLAADLQRYLAGKAVAAKRSSWRKVILRKLKRDPKVTLFRLALSLVVVAAVVAASFYRQRVAETSARADLAEVKLSDIRFAEAMRKGLDRLQVMDVIGVHEILDEYAGDTQARGNFAYQALDHVMDYPDPLVLLGHEGHVGEVATRPEHPDEIVSVGEDGTIRRWNWRTGVLLDTIEASSRPLYALALSPDGKIAATGNQILALWDLEARKMLQPLATHETTLEEIDYSPIGKRIASASRFQEIQVHTRLPSGAWDPLSVLRIASDAPHETLRFTDETTLVGADSKAKAPNRIRAWDARTGRLIKEYPPVASSSDLSAAISNDGKLLATSGASEVVLRELPSGHELWRSRPSPEQTRDIRFSPTDSHLAMAGYDGTLRLLRLDAVPNRWGLPQNDPRGGFRIIKAHEGRITSVCFPDDTHVVSAGLDGSIAVWELQNLSSFEIPITEPTRHLAVTHDGERCLTSTPNNHLELRQTSSQEVIWRKPISSMSTPAAGLSWPQLSKDARYALTRAKEPYVRVWDLQRGEVCFDAEVDESSYAAALSPDGRWLATTDREYSLAVWDIASEELILRMKIDNPCHNLKFSDDSSLLAATQETGVYTFVIDTSTWKIRNRLVCESDPTDLTFCPVRDELATAHLDGSIRLWESRTGRLVGILRGMKNSKARLTYHPSGDTLVACNLLDGLVLWDLKTERRLGTLFHGRPHRDVRHLSFSKDGQLFVHFLKAPWLLRVGGAAP